MPRELHVANLSVTVDDHELERLFAACGAVQRAKVTTLCHDGSNTRAGFVEMRSDAEGRSAIAALNGRYYGGNLLKVGWATQRQKNDADHSSMFESMNIVEDD